MAEEKPPINLPYLMGFDAPKFWANAAQVHVSDEATIIVFRERVRADIEADGEKKGLEAEKNVVSLVVPKNVAVEAAKIILRLTGENNEGKA